MENVGVFYDRLEYSVAICYNLWPYGIDCGHLIFFTVLVCFDQEKSGNPCHVHTFTHLCTATSKYLHGYYHYHVCRYLPTYMNVRVTV
jgi:hypothetical protein